MPFPFLQLPTETRLAIYKLLLPYSEYHVEGEESDSPVRWHPGKYNCPSILFVNRQIHREAAEILYHENFFAIYIKHPHKPRLPMNDSRADPESFVLISRIKSPKLVMARKDRSWAHPQHPRIPMSILRSHQNFHQIRKFHVSLPPFDGLAGVDMFMKKTSFAAFNGVNSWIEKCARKGGYLDLAEQERMSIVQQLKGPIDELGQLLQTLGRIDQLSISVQQAPFQITFSEYLVEELLKAGPVRRTACFLNRTRGWWTLDDSEIRRWDYLLQSMPRKRTKEYQLPPETDGMYQLLQAIRTYQQLDFVPMHDWLAPMPA